MQVSKKVAQERYYCYATPSLYFNIVELNADGIVELSKQLKTVIRRQDAPKCYDMNASIHVETPRFLPVIRFSMRTPSCMSCRKNGP